MEAHNIPTAIHDGGQLRKSTTVKILEGTRKEFLRMAGPGRLLALQHLFLLADPRARGKKGGKRKDLWDAIRAIEAKGAILWELSTGRRSDNPEQRDTMIEDAIEALAKGRHKAGPHDRRAGRPKKTFPPNVLEHNRKVWDSRRHKSWDECEEHFIGGMTKHDAWKEFGKRNGD
jgi:hypothetical protein